MKITRLLVAALLAAVTLVALGAYMQQQPPGQRREGGPPPPPEFPPPDTVLIRQSLDKLNKAIEEKADSPAAKVFQNVTIHKEMPAKRFLGMMGAWTRTFGVDCSHCHVVDQWEKDDKAPKQTARAMDKFM